MLTKEEIAELKQIWNDLIAYCSWEETPSHLAVEFKRARELMQKLEESVK